MIKAFQTLQAAGALARSAITSITQVISLAFTVIFAIRFLQFAWYELGRILK